MADNIVNARIQLKNDTEAHWDQATNFTPRQGEVIIYNVDDTHLFPRIKIGNGSTNVNSLPFITTPFESLPTGTSASTVAIGNHTHSLNNLTKKALTTSTINTNKTTDIIYSSSAGKFFGHTSNVDWVGLQFGTSNDRFQLVAQLVADSNTLLFRQNDYASPTASNWSAWQQFVHIPFNGGNGGAGNGGSKEEGSETVATPVYIATNGTATPIAYTIGSDVPIGAVFTDTNQYHKTGSWNGLTYTAEAVNDADELMFTIPDNYGDTKNPYASKIKNQVLAAPSTANGVPSFRELVAADIPDLSSTYLKLDGSNNMDADVNIIAGNQDRFVNFLYDTEKKAGASWRLGILGTGLEDANYFVIQSGTSTISDTNWTNALQIGMNTHNINVLSTTPSTTTSTGALTVSGGLGVAGQVTAGTLKSGNITIGGTVDTTAGRTISCNNTLYINRGASTSIIFSEYNVNKMRIDASNAFRPETTNTLSIGTSDKKWANVYATNLHGTLATTDLSGIVSTTAKKFLKDTGTWTQVDWGDLTNVPNTFTPSAHEHNYIGKNGFIAYPSDGRYGSSNNAVTGYIKIKIPQTKSMTMFTFDVDIYNYITSTSTRYHIGGYNYTNASWLNCTAYCIAPLSNAKANLPVRFLSNGNDEMYVTIGEIDTNWNHPQITIHNIAISFGSQATLEKWKSGWTVTIDSTAFDNSLVKQIITNTNIAYTAENVTGTVAIANGGTGTATTTPNYVFAGPNSGSTAGAPSFRKLVAADIPDISETYLKLTGGTMTGAINLVGNQSSAYNDNGLIFTQGSRIGENNNGGLGIYAAERIYLRPDSPTSPSSDGIEINGSGMIPSNNNTETLGDSSHKWSNVYATNLNGNLSITAHTNTTNGSKNYYPWFSTATSGNLGARAHAGVYIHETVANGAISSLDFCMGSTSITGSLTLWDGTNHWGNVKPTNLSANRTYTLPDATGTIALTSSNITGTAANVTGVVAITNGGTGANTANAAANALLSGLPDWTANPSDDVKLIRRDTAGSATFGQIKFSTVWNYINTKAASVYAPLTSPTLTGTPTAPTAANGTNTTQIATTEFVNNALAYVNAMTFKGTLGTGGTITALPASHNAGDTYRVITAGTWAGKYCEVGTLIICVADGTAAADADWTSVETNEDGAVIGPLSSTANQVPKFNSNTGRVITNSEVKIDDNNNITTTGSYIESAGGRIQHVQLLSGGAWSNYAVDTWYRCCKIASKYNSANCLVELSGLWSTGAPTMATISITLSSINITLLHCSRVGVIKSMRLVKDNTDNKYWIDVQLNMQSSGSMGQQTATFIGNVIVSDINTTATAVTDETAAATLTFATIYNDNTIYKIAPTVNIVNTTDSTTTATGALIVNGGVGIGGRTTAQEFNATRTMVVNAGKVYSNISSSNVLIPAKTGMMFANGIAFANPGITPANDVGWIRILGTSESDTVLEIATGDDGDTSTGEKIVVRQYNSSNGVAKEAILLDKQTGATSFPVSVTSPSFIGALTGNASTASSLTSITNDDAATSSATWRRLWISYNNNTTGRPAYTDNLVYQTSTNTLKTPHLLIEHASGNYGEMHITYGSTINYWWGVGTSNIYYGLYDNKASGGAKWILSAGSDNVWTFVGNVTGNVSGSSGSCTGNAATATDIQTAGTTAQFYRGDNSWSNIIKQTANVALGINTNLKIGTARKDLNFDITNGSGVGINDGYAGGITWGAGDAAYAGIYYQTSSNYGSRLIFGTTNLYANGAYARMIIQNNGNVGIGTLSPDTLLTVNGNAKATKFIGALEGNADTASKISAKLATTTKTYLLGTSTAITATAANVDITGDTGVYLTTTAGELSATRYSWNVSGTEKAYAVYNTTDNSIDFIFI